MLVHTVSFGGAAVVGSRDLSIMAVSRAWGHSFSGLRRLHSLRSVSLCMTWPHPSLEPVAQQRPASSRHVRFIAQAAALDDSSDLHQRRGIRLSRAERYALVENFVMRHKEAHEGKWPSVNAIIKEIGGSRLIVKDIVDELEKNSMVHADGESGDMQDNAFDTSTKLQGRSGVEGLAGEYTDNEEDEESPMEAEVSYSSDGIKATQSGSESLSDEQTAVNDESLNSSGSLKSESREDRSDAGLWRSLRNLGQQENQVELQHEQEQKISSAQVGDYYGEEGEEDEDDDDEDEDEDGDEDDDDQALNYTPETYRTLKENRPKSASGRSSWESNVPESHGMFIRFLPLAASEMDLRAAYQDCGEIVRAQAMVPRGSGLKFTYGFIDFSTPEALSKALKKDKVMVKGSTILTEACSGSRRTPESRSSRKQAPEHFKKSETHRTSDRNSDGRTINGARSLPTNRFKSHTGMENGSKTSTNESYLVAVEGLPYPMPISAVEKMLSAHGVISRSELAREEGGTYSAHVEFKTEEARDSALAASRVYLGGRWCRITTGEPILTTVVRLSNVGNASEGFILQRCGKVGRVDNIVQRKEGVVDVYYHPYERRNMRKILDRLGDVHADFKRWHANLAPKCSLEEIRNSAEIQEWAEGQKDRLLDNLTGTMKSMLIDLEDLRELIDAERRIVPNSGKSRTFDRSTVKSNRS